MYRLWQDLRHGARALVRTPLPTGLAVLTLTLGIGANTAIFSVISGLLIKPWPFPAPDRLLAVSDTSPRRGISRFTSAPANFGDWRQENRSFSGLAAYSTDRFTLTGGARPVALGGAAVSGNFFTVLGARPFAGRFFRDDDDRPAAEPVVVLSFDTWRSYFGGDASLIGKRIQVDGRGRTLIGVAGGDLAFPERTDLWLPLALDYAHSGRGGHFLSVFGRLLPGRTVAQAQADLSTIARRLAQQYPDKDADWGVWVESLAASAVADIRPALILLESAVWAVLLIACTNVASLLLARFSARGRDLAMRAALGAGRLGLTRLVLAESVVLAIAGGGLGLLLAEVGTRRLATLVPGAIPRPAAISVDGRVLLYSLALSLLAGLLIGLAPAAVLARGRIQLTLRGNEPGVVGGGGRRVRRGLVIGEVALTLALLAASGLLLRSFARLAAVRHGFESARVLTADLSLPAARYATPAEQAQFAQHLVERVRALPGVDDAATVYPLPLSGSTIGLTFAIAGRPRPAGADAEMPSASIITVGPDYFKVLSIPVVTGRAFTEGDRLESEPVAIVNRTLAHRYWGDASPLGQHVLFSAPGSAPVRSLTIVGVVGDVRAATLRQEASPQIYWPELQRPSPDLTLVLRSRAAPGGLFEPLRRAVLAIDPNLPLDQARTLDAVVAASLADARAQTAVLATFGGLTLVLAAIGIFGVVSYTVSQRQREIGIRLALGASRGAVLAMLLKDAMGPVGLGLALGLGLTWMSGRWLGSRLYGISATDPITVASVVLLLAVVALVANLLPVRRALRADPFAALRAEEP